MTSEQAANEKAIN